MRAWIFLLPLLLLLTACPQPDQTEPEQPVQMIDLVKTPLELEAQGVSITEIARYSPPENIVWPYALDYERRTNWKFSDGSPVLYTATAGEWSVPDEEDSEPVRGPAKIYTWNLIDGTASVVEIEHDLPIEINQPIVIHDPDTGSIRFVFTGTGGESATQAVTIDEEEPMPIAIVDEVLVFDSDGSLVHESHISTAQHELYAGSVFTSIDTTDSWCLVYRELTKHPVTVREQEADQPGLTLLADTWSYYDTTRGRLVLLENIVEKTGAARFDGFLDDPAWFFFSSDREYDEGPATYVVHGPNDMIALAPYGISDDPEEIPTVLRVTGYIPPVFYEGSHIVFFDTSSDSDDSTSIVAVKFDGDNILESSPSIIWSAEIPPIFGVSTSVSTSSGRPYIICLDPFSGDLTIFDPLNGAIRFQSNIELADWRLGSPLASFCHYISSGSMDSTILIHDPNANEIIELEITTSEIRSGEITPIIVPDT